MYSYSQSCLYVVDYDLVIHLAHRMVCCFSIPAGIDFTLTAPISPLISESLVNRLYLLPRVIPFQQGGCLPAYSREKEQHTRALFVINLTCGQFYRGLSCQAWAELALQTRASSFSLMKVVSSSSLYSVLQSCLIGKRITIRGQMGFVRNIDQR